MLNGKKILIVGSGQLGCRHLQSLLSLSEYKLMIDVVEPNEVNIKNTQTLISAEKFNRENISVNWFSNIRQISNRYDLAVVATTSTVRTEILNYLSGKFCDRFLIEKIICRTDDEYKSILSTFKKNGSKGWINCTRRYFDFYTNLIEKFKFEKTIYFNVIAGNHGLGCNAIHFLDLFYALTGEKQKIKLHGKGLINKIYSNARGSDLSEFSGIITGQAGDNNISIQFHPNNTAPVQIEILTDNYRVKIDESSNKAYIFDSKNQWKAEEYPFNIIFTSQLTAVIANNILVNDTCKLATLESAYCIHKELFTLFNNHIKNITGKKCLVCPIT